MADDSEEEEEYGKHFGRIDLDRVGFFDDAPPGPWDVFSNQPLGSVLREGSAVGKQMTCSRVGRLLDPELKRLFIGEADKDDVPPPKSKPGKEEEEPSKVDPKPLIRPPGYPKKHSTPGDWYGCIGKPTKHFSPETNPEEPRESMPPNFKTNPSPFGGPGYADYCINRYVKMYKGWEPYDYEDALPKKVPEPEGPRKKIFVTTILPRPYFTENPYAPKSSSFTNGSSSSRRRMIKQPPKMKFFLTFPRAPLGPNNGCFHPFPLGVPDPYEPMPKKKAKRVKKPTPFHSIGVPEVKSKFTESIIDRVTRVACNAVTYADYREQVYPLR